MDWPAKYGKTMAMYPSWVFGCGPLSAGQMTEFIGYISLRYDFLVFLDQKHKMVEYITGQVCFFF